MGGRWGQALPEGTARALTRGWPVPFLLHLLPTGTMGRGSGLVTERKRAGRSYQETRKLYFPLVNTGDCYIRRTGDQPES